MGRIAGGRQAIEDGEVFPPIDSSPLRWRRPVLDLPFEIGQEALEPRVLVPVWVNDVKRGIDLVEAREEHR